MTRATRAALAGAILAGALAPPASAHELTDTSRTPGTPIHPPQAPPNLRVEDVPGLSHTAAVVSWDEPHSHHIRHVRHERERFGIRGFDSSRDYRDYWITLRTTPLPSTAGTIDRCIDRSATAPPGCIRRSHSALARFHGPAPGVLSSPVTTTTYPLSRRSLTVHDLTPETTYYVHVAGIFAASGKTYAGAGTTATFTTAANPDGTPETPGTVATPGCSYEHRIVGVPGTTTGGYIGRVWVSSKMPNATASIRAYQGDNGHPLDVLDKEGNAVESVTLAPANSIQRFRTEAAQGWHVVTITHPSATAMHAASVVLRVRGPEGVQILPIPPAEHCEPTPPSGTDSQPVRAREPREPATSQ